MWFRLNRNALCSIHFNGRVRGKLTDVCNDASGIRHTEASEISGNGYMAPYSKTTDRRLSLYGHHKCVHGTMAYTGYDGALSCWKRLQLNSDGNNTLGDTDWLFSMGKMAVWWEHDAFINSHVFWCRWMLKGRVNRVSRPSYQVLTTAAVSQWRKSACRTTYNQLSWMNICLSQYIYVRVCMYRHNDL